MINITVIFYIYIVLVKCFVRQFTGRLLFMRWVLFIRSLLFYIWYLNFSKIFICPASSKYCEHFNTTSDTKAISNKSDIGNKENNSVNVSLIT